MLEIGTPMDRASTGNQPLRFACPQCLTWYRASQSAAGKRQRCPRCHYVFAVPNQTQRAAPGEPYPLAQEGGPAGLDPTIYIPVFCPVCHTRMDGTLEQVGQELTCPDCGTETVVPPPPPTPVISSEQPGQFGEYALLEEFEPTQGAKRADQETLIRVTCPLCRTIMYATLDQVGGRMTCPDCKSPVVVPPPPPKKKPIDVMGDSGVGYRLAGESASEARGVVPPMPPLMPPPPMFPAAPPVVGAAEEPHVPFDSGRTWGDMSKRPVLPRWPFFTGVFSFPLARGVPMRLLLLTVWALIAYAFVLFSLRVIAAGFAMNNAAVVMAGGMLMAISVVMTVMWFSLISACFLAVVRETAHGCDEILEWPDIAFIDWLFEPLYLFTCIGISAAPGLGLEWLMGQYGRNGQLALPIFFIILFPILILSALEQGTPWGVVSGTVYRTFWKAWKGWLAFYATSTLLLAAAGVLATTGVYLAVPPSNHVYLGGLVVAFVGVTALFVYFRLLGRLAWYCTERTRVVVEEEEEEEEFIVIKPGGSK
jgi:predicted Zn finger-like uncharacterized protein